MEHVLKWIVVVHTVVELLMVFVVEIDCMSVKNKGK